VVSILWDASTLAKRYAPELGRETVKTLWAIVPPAQMMATFPIYAETYSLLLRKRNRQEMTNEIFAAAKSLLRTEVIDSPDFVMLATDAEDVLAGIVLMERHSINSSDAAFLAVCLRYAPPLGEVCVLVASDQRLLRAAAAEGLRTLNPEQAAADVPAFLAVF